MSRSVTVEEAVTLMVNMDFVPEGETVQSMTAAFLEDAKVEYENASIHDEYLIKVLKNRIEACEARHNLVLLLTKSLFEDAVYNEDTLIECSDDSTDENPLVTLDSLYEWAYDRFGIAIPNKDVAILEAEIQSSNTKVPSWEDVTIKIYADYKIGYTLDNIAWKRSSFLDIGLMGKRKLVPNEQGIILIKLSNRIKYPANGSVQGSQRTATSKLRRHLAKLTGLSVDPFLPFNKADGYKPRFTLIDDTRNAAERAKEEAVHVIYDDALQYESEKDEAGDWLKENER